MRQAKETKELAKERERAKLLAETLRAEYGGTVTSFATPNLNGTLPALPPPPPIHQLHQQPLLLYDAPPTPHADLPDVQSKKILTALDEISKRLPPSTATVKKTADQKLDEVIAAIKREKDDSPPCRQPGVVTPILPVANSSGSSGSDELAAVRLQMQEQAEVIKSQNRRIAELKEKPATGATQTAARVVPMPAAPGNQPAEITMETTIPAATLRLLSAETGHVVDLGTEEKSIQQLLETLTTSPLTTDAHKKKIARFIERYQAPGGVAIPTRMRDRVRRMLYVAASL